MLPPMWPRNFNSFRLGIPLIIAIDLLFSLGWLLTGTGHRNCTLRLDRAKSSPHLTPRLFHCYKAEGDWKKGLDETFDWLLCKTATRASLVVAYENHRLASGFIYRDLTDNMIHAQVTWKSHCLVSICSKIYILWWTTQSDCRLCHYLGTNYNRHNVFPYPFACTHRS